MLLTGPSGAGKSDLLLRAVEAGWRLVADDRVILWSAAGRVFGRAPASLSGLIELRGQGMAFSPPLPFCRIMAIAELGPATDRQPEPERRTLAGVALPLHPLRPLEASAVARLRRIVERLDPQL